MIYILFFQGEFFYVNLTLLTILKVTFTLAITRSGLYIYILRRAFSAGLD